MKGWGMEMTEQETIEMIKNEWFEHHVAEITEFEGTQILYWRKPGTSMYSIKYVLHDSNVFVAGDLGEAVYWLTCSSNLKNIKDHDFHYFTSKLTTSSRHKYYFDKGEAKRQLDDYWKEYEIEDEKTYQSILDVIDESLNYDEYTHNLYAYYQYNSTEIDCDSFEDIDDFGKEYSPVLFSYWIGLQMACEQLGIK